MFVFSFFHLIQSSPTEEVEHADILELNTIIDTLKKEKEEVEKEKVCICWQSYGTTKGLKFSICQIS